MGARDFFLLSCLSVSICQAIELSWQASALVWEKEEEEKEQQHVCTRKPWLKPARIYWNIYACSEYSLTEGYWKPSLQAHAGVAAEQPVGWSTQRDEVELELQGVELMTPCTWGKRFTAWATVLLETESFSFIFYKVSSNGNVQHITQHLHSFSLLCSISIMLHAPFILLPSPLWHLMPAFSTIFLFFSLFLPWMDKKFVPPENLKVWRGKEGLLEHRGRTHFFFYTYSASKVL